MNRARMLAVATTFMLLALGGTAHALIVFPSSKDFGSQAVGTAGSAASFQLQTSPTGCSTFDMFGNCSRGQEEVQEEALS